MHFSKVFAATLVAFTSTTLAAPTANPNAAAAAQDTTPDIVTPPEMQKRDDCKTFARTTKDWTENALTRRRVEFMVLNKAGVDLKKLGKKWDDGTEKCSAIANNMQVYRLKNDGNWVVESNEVMGPAGDNAHNCLLGRFQRKIARDTNCDDDGDGRD